VTRGVAAALIIWTGLAIGWALFVFGGHVQMCLGPLHVTPESCRIALGLPPETDWDRFVNGPGLLAAILIVGWLAILLAGRRRKRQRGGL
jgi:hypothetical protein